MKRGASIGMAGLLSAALLLGGCGVDDKLGTPSVIGNERSFEEEAFADPDLQFRPLPIIHAGE